MDRRDNFFRQLVSEQEFDIGFTLAEDADRSLTKDAQLAQRANASNVPFADPQSGDYDGLLGGIHAGFKIGFSPPASGGNPQSLINVPVTAGLAHDPLGQRIVTPSRFLDITGAGDTPIGQGGATTGGAAVTPAPGNTRIVTVMVLFDRQLLDPRVDGNSLTVFFERNESYRFRAKAGAASTGTPDPPTADPNSIVLVDFTVNSSSQIVGQSFKRRGDWIRTTTGGSGDVSLTNADESEPALPTNKFIQGDPRRAILRVLRELAVTGGDLTAHKTAGAAPVGLGHRVEGIELLAIVPPYTAPHTFALGDSNLQVALQAITNELNAIHTFVTVGDGVATFGDFNVDDFATARDCLQAAVDTISSTGTGTIFIKRGAVPYDIGNTTVSISGASKRVKIVGEAPSTGVFGQVHLRAAGTAPVFTTVGGGTVLELDNIDCEITGSATASISVEATIFARRCRLERLTSTAPVSSSGSFEDCTFTADTGTSFNGPWKDSRWDTCRFNGSGTAAIINFTNPVVTQLGNLHFRNCKVVDAGGSVAAVLVDFAESYFNVTIDGFDITGTGSGFGMRFKRTTVGSEQLNLRDIRITAVAAGIEFEAGARHVNIDGWRIDLTAGVGMLFSAGTGLTRDVTIKDCFLKGGASAYVGMQFFGGVRQIALSDTTFEDVRTPIETNGMSDSSISSCRAIQQSVGFCAGFLKFIADTNCRHLSINDCEFDGFSFDGDIRVIDGETAAGTRTIEEVAIKACRFRSIGTGSGANANTKGIAIVPGTSGTLRAITVTDCTFASMSGTGVTRAIDLSGVERPSIHDNTFNLIGSVLGSSTANLNLIRLYNCNRLSVHHNSSLIFGNATAGALSAAILVDANVQQDSGTIDHNVIEDNRADDCRAIWVNAGYRRLSITGNSIRPKKIADAVGIFIRSNEALGSGITSVIGNEISEVLRGIQLSLKETISDGYSGGRFAIAGNNIDDFEKAIQIEADGGFSLANNFAVTGNVLRTAILNMIGITVTNIKDFTIQGNVLTSTGVGTGTARGMKITTSANGQVSGNMIRMADTDAAVIGIQVDDATTMLGVHVNTIMMEDCNGAGIVLGSGTVAGQETQTAQGNNIRMNLIGAPIACPNPRQKRANSDTDPFLPFKVPTALSDITTNWQYSS
jgi:hypothetical protein